jgi:hypothetical protein
MTLIPRLRFTLAALLAAPTLVLTGCGASVESAQNGNASGGAASGVGGGGATGGSGHALGGNVGVGGQAAGGNAAGGSFAGTGGMNCALVDCAFPICPPNSTWATLAGNCCPTCVPIDPSCSSVVCSPVTSCNPGFVRQRPLGACCDSCVPVNPPAPPDCIMYSCAPPTNCPLGYRHSQPVYNCCNDCEPDPNYCELDSDCLIAQKPSGCCGCPSSISTRLYAQDNCYSATNAPRSVPSQCLPQVICDMMCGACPPTGVPACLNHQCTAVYPL